MNNVIKEVQNKSYLVNSQYNLEELLMTPESDEPTTDTKFYKNTIMKSSTDSEFININRIPIISGEDLQLSSNDENNWKVFTNLELSTKLIENVFDEQGLESVIETDWLEKTSPNGDCFYWEREKPQFYEKNRTINFFEESNKRTTISDYLMNNLKNKFYEVKAIPVVVIKTTKNLDSINYSWEEIFFNSLQKVGGILDQLEIKNEISIYISDNELIGLNVECKEIIFTHNYDNIKFIKRCYFNNIKSNYYICYVVDGDPDPFSCVFMTKEESEASTFFAIVSQKINDVYSYHDFSQNDSFSQKKSQLFECDLIIKIKDRYILNEDDDISVKNLIDNTISNELSEEIMITITDNLLSIYNLDNNILLNIESNQIIKYSMGSSSKSLGILYHSDNFNHFISFECIPNSLLLLDSIVSLTSQNIYHDSTEKKNSSSKLSMILDSIKSKFSSKKVTNQITPLKQIYECTRPYSILYRGYITIPRQWAGPKASDEALKELSDFEPTPGLLKLEQGIITLSFINQNILIDPENIVYCGITSDQSSFCLVTNNSEDENVYECHLISDSYGNVKFLMTSIHNIM